MAGTARGSLSQEWTRRSEVPWSPRSVDRPVSGCNWARDGVTSPFAFPRFSVSELVLTAPALMTARLRSFPGIFSSRVRSRLRNGILCSIGHLFPRQCRPLMHLPTTWQGSLCRRRPLSFSVRSIRFCGAHKVSLCTVALCLRAPNAPKPYPNGAPKFPCPA